MRQDQDKRSELRLQEEIAVFVEYESSPDNKGKISFNHTQDISANGLQVISDKSLPLNSIHQICIEVGSEKFYLVAEVVWLRDTDGHCAIGFQLLDSHGTDIGSWKEYICKRLGIL